MSTIKMAIIGAGMIAKHMANAMALCPDVERYAVASTNEARAKEFAENFGFEKAYGSYEQLLADPAVELVYIALPHALHSKAALMCLEAGKHVICEKPFTANAEQARAVIEKAKEKHLLAAEGIWMLYQPMVKTLKEIIVSGTIGDIAMLTGSIGYHLTQERLFDPAMAGGALLDVGVYAIALAGLVFGYDVEDMKSTVKLTERGVDELASYMIRWKNGGMASLTTSMKFMSDSQGTIWGDKGYITLNNVNNIGIVDVYGADKKQVAHYEKEPCPNAYLYELRSAVKALRDGRIDTPEAPHEEILSRMALMDALRAEWGVRYPFE